VRCMSQDRSQAGVRGSSHLPAVVVVAVALGCIVAVPTTFLHVRSHRSAPAPTRASSGPEALLEGENIYQRSCASCHRPRGNGKPPDVPPLVGSRWLLDDDARTPIRILLLGVDGPIEVGGVRYQSPMPNLGVTLSDDDIAKVLTFARASWGHRAAPIEAAQVAEVRAALGGRTAPWKGGAELEQAAAGR
jgi:mono/diheme cytochrome c family protein